MNRCGGAAGVVLDVAGQVASLRACVRDRGFLATSAGDVFLAGLRAQVVPGLLAEGRRFGFPLEADEVVNTILVGLFGAGGRVAEYVAGCEDPFAYLSVCARGWVRGLWGHRCVSLDAPASGSDGVRCVGDVVAVEPGERSDGRLPGMVRATGELLVSVTDPVLADGVRDLVGWFAVNVPQRRSYEYELVDVARAACVPGFTREQVAVVMRAVYGVRPRQAVTSLFGMYLCGGFSRCALFTVAVDRYRCGMRDASVTGVSLSSWVSQFTREQGGHTLAGVSGSVSDGVVSGLSAGRVVAA